MSLSQDEPEKLNRRGGGEWRLYCKTTGIVRISAVRLDLAASLGMSSCSTKNGFAGRGVLSED